MANFKIQPFISISGVGAASGLHFSNGNVYLISDKRNMLLEYNLESAVVKHWPLLPDSSQDNLPKNLKADFEAIAADGKLLYIFSSGSTENRNKLVIFDTETKSAQARNLDQFYENLRNVAAIEPGDFNIEGAAVLENKWFLLQRGNGPGNKNGLFVFSANPFKESCEVTFHAIALPEIAGCRASFTDATVYKDRLFFIAAAEAGNSTYEDGAVAGSLIGSIDLQSLSVQFTTVISPTHKFEGLSFFEETANTISFLLCEDNDSEETESMIFVLRLNKSPFLQNKS
ncbi:MAG: hypothetical protein EOO51_02155 [Flavobacterium sp.]|nr:MAG: hypothetical protein EOO51_02155 [Flavobacterium sp.]